VKIGSLWGEVEVQRYRYRCGCGHQGQGYRDESLDESGYLPECLRRIHGTTLRMSYREAEAWLGEWGVKVGKSSLQVLGIRLEQHEQGLSREGLTQNLHLLHSLHKPAFPLTSSGGGCQRPRA
jgi:hypothetical protein